MRAWRVHEYGAPAEVLTLDDVEIPTPGDGELLIRVEAITLNFNDVDGIHGRYKTVRTPMPYIPGMEVMGTVDACGPGAEAWAGQRVVAIPSGAFGGYAEYASAPTAMTFAMPESIPLPAAAPSCGSNRFAETSAGIGDWDGRHAERDADPTRGSGKRTSTCTSVMAPRGTATARRRNAARRSRGFRWTTRLEPSIAIQATERRYLWRPSVGCAAMTEASSR